MSGIKNQIETFIRNVIKDDRLTEEDNFYDVGYVNSLFSIQLITFLEKTFSFTIEQADMDIENFCSINAISAFVESKLSNLNK